MGRWEPNAQDRLVRAALELFTEQGYEKTTVVEIAERAGLTKSTFFRYFPDKREVLFAGQETISGFLTEGIAAAPSSATPLDVLAAALDAAGEAFPAERRAFGPHLRAVIANNGELQERDAHKHAGFGTAMHAALRQRGLPELTASLVAHIGVLALKLAYARWSEPTCQESFAEIARETVDELRPAIDVLDATSVAP